MSVGLKLIYPDTEELIAKYKEMEFTYCRREIKPDIIEAVEKNMSGRQLLSFPKGNTVARKEGKKK